VPHASAATAVVSMPAKITMTADARLRINQVDSVSSFSNFSVNRYYSN
jgi:hypothetical protein